MPTVTIDGESHDVDASDIEFGEGEVPDGFVTQDEVDDIVKKRINRETRDTLRELGLKPSDFKTADGYDLSGDAAFRKLAQQRGIELREDGRPKGAVKDDELQELRKKASKVDSLQEQVSEYESQIQGTRETRLENELMQSAQGVRDDMGDVFMTYAKSQMTYTEDYGWVQTDENGDIVYEGGEPRGPEEVVAEMEESKPGFFKEVSMNDGPSSSPSDDPVGGETVARSEFESWSAQKQHEFTQEKGGAVVDDE